MSDDNQKDKQYETEWSFSFDKIGKNIGSMFESLSGDEEAQMASFSEAINGATGAAVDVRFSLGESTVKPLVASDNLFEADVTYVGEINFDTSGEAERQISLRQKQRPGSVMKGIRQSIGSIANREELRWDVRLSPDVPLDLELHGGVGRVNLDLAGLNLRQFRFDGGVGESEINLPTSDETYDVRLDSGVGATNLTLPQNTSANVTIKAGVGAVKVHLPADVAVRFNVKGGLGQIKMPSSLHEVETKDDMVSKSGIWETPGYEESEKRITVNYKGGVGAFTVVSDVTVV